MMGRLIDAEQAKLMLSELLEVAKKENFTAEDAISHAFEWVENLPTAYDTEKVVAEIRNQPFGNYGVQEESEIIDIVKRGGAE